MYIAVHRCLCVREETEAPHRCTFFFFWGGDGGGYVTLAEYAIFGLPGMVNEPLNIRVGIVLQGGAVIALVSAILIKR